MSRKIYFLLLAVSFQVNANCKGQDLTCKILDCILQHSFFKSKEEKEIYIVDSLSIFSSNCLFSDTDKKIFIVKEKPSKFAIVTNNLFYVSGIGIRENLLQIAINSPRRGYQVIFFLAVFGNEVKIRKTKSGTPPYK